jgi:hypothetical protein
VPSFPKIPTPIWASWIIETSFAPSPIANVIHFPLDFTNPTTSAFYFGETLQQIHELAIRHNLKNPFYTALLELKIKARVIPSITTHIFYFSFYYYKINDKLSIGLLRSTLNY